MPGPSGSPHFRALFESALQAYQTKTGITLAEHAFAVQLQSCTTVESITTLVQGQAQAFSRYREGDRIMKSIKTTISILIPLSAAAPLADVVGLVRQIAMVVRLTFLIFFWQSFPPAKAIQAGLAILLDVCAALQIICRYPSDIEVDQVAKGVTSSWDALIELLESIEHFLNRLDIYTRIPRTPAMDEIVLKIIVELLSTLALATRELKQGRSSEPILTDVLPHSPQHSQICEEGFRREGLRSGPAEARPTHTRRGSDHRSSDPRGRVRSRPKYECGHERRANTLRS
jgi:hypothetical protein